MSTKEVRGIRVNKRTPSQKKEEQGENTIGNPCYPLQNEIENHQVFNLSAKILSHDQVTVLSFSPTRNFDLYSTILDINRLARNITVCKHFCTIDSESFSDDACNVSSFNAISDVNNDNVLSLTSHKSTYSFQDLVAVSNLHGLEAESGESHSSSHIPHFRTKNESFYTVQSRTESLEVFQECVEEDLVQLYSSTQHTQPKYNLSSRKRIALRELTEIPDIIIRKADKGGAINVLDKEIYRSENLRLLSDTSTYRCLATDPTLDFRKILLKLIEKGTTCGVLNRKKLPTI